MYQTFKRRVSKDLIFGKMVDQLFTYAVIHENDEPEMKIGTDFIESFSPYKLPDGKEFHLDIYESAEVLIYNKIPLQKEDKNKIEPIIKYLKKKRLNDYNLYKNIRTELDNIMLQDCGVN